MNKVEPFKVGDLVRHTGEHCPELDGSLGMIWDIEPRTSYFGQCYGIFYAGIPQTENKDNLWWFNEGQIELAY